MFKVGWAQRELTFDKPVMLQGQMHVRVSQGEQDPLTVTALALESEGAAVLWLGCDLVGIPEELLAATRAEVVARLPDFDTRFVVMNGTHTHTGPTLLEGTYVCPPDVEIVTPAECLRLTAETAAEAAAEAWTNRAPGGITRGFGHAVVGHNRRAAYLDGSAQMYGATDIPAFSHIEGYEDHSLDLLFTVDGEGQLSGVVVNLACPSQETEGDMLISADFWHEIRVELRRRLGDGLFVLPQCSAAGDQSPHLLLHKRAELYMLARRGLTMRQEIGRRVGEVVGEVYSVVHGEVVTDPCLEHRVETVELPGRAITEADYQAALTQLQGLSDQDPASGWRPRRLHEVIAAYEAGKGKPPVRVEVHALRLGDVALVTNPFELFLDYGERIKARSAAEQTFVVQLACGTHGYLPSRKAVGLSYSGQAVDNEVGPESGDLLVERTLALIDGLWEEQNGADQAS